ncbi:MAG: CheR family methyltransferase, partial [Chloroflexota bacterium]
MGENGDGRQLDNLLDYVRRNRGFDFTGYKRASLTRRVDKRLHEVGINSYAEYLNYLEVQPEEFNQLFNTILINVTSFFRDPASWEFLAQEVVPRLVQAKKSNEPIRVWCPGVASGEEAYTTAIVLAESLGDEAFRNQVKVYGTDVDEEALNVARQAAYSEHQLEGLPKELREKYTQWTNDRFYLRKEIRRAVIFGRHDLVQDPPISRIDLLVCRNTLMYFNAETQTKILNRLHFALSNQGYMFLGKAEMLLTRAHLFTPLDVTHRVFSKVARPLQYRETAPSEEHAAAEGDGRVLGNGTRIRELAQEAAPVAQLVVDAGGSLLAANERARAMFGIAPADVGRPLRDMEVSYRPVDLRTLIDEASTQRRPGGVVGAEWRRASGEVSYLDVQVVPILGEGEEVLGASIAVLDVSRRQQLQEENLRARQELERYTQELQAANEELETTNEELQSTNEELETTNEELQSANEELETMNEEMQSTNQELETINDELQQRTNALNRTNAYSVGVLASLGIGVAVLDRELRVQLWNRQSNDLWGLREDEVRDQHFFDLDIGLPVAELREPLLACLVGQDGRVDMVVDAIDRRGRALRCRVRCGALLDASRQTEGIILLMDTGGGHGG